MICPTCKKEIERADTDFPPFCSERCKLIDLGRWFDGTYSLPGEPADIPDNMEGEGES
jgi:endogenous inhibitor of DNA gyrase (YacG/DUF329 family)